MPSEYVLLHSQRRSGSESFLKKLRLRGKKASRQEEGFLLPERVEMRQISWKEKITDNSILLFALFVAAGCILYRLQDRDLKKKLERLLGAEYTEFLESYEKERKQGLRLNLLKTSRKKFEQEAPFSLSPIPWTEEGYYYGK